MSWLRIEGKMPGHKKVATLSDKAFRLHVTAQCWCVQEETDGLVPAGIPGTLTSAPRGKALASAIAELVGHGLWDPMDDGGHVIHDFLDYNPTAAQSKARREAAAIAGAAGGKAKASGQHGKKVPPPIATGKPDASEPLSGSLPTRVGSDPDSDSDPHSTTTTARARGDLRERLVQPTPTPGQPPPPRKDPLGERLPFTAWFPSQAMLDHCRASGLPDSSVDAALVEARDALTGRHDFEWFDVKVWRYLDVAIDRNKNPKRATPPGQLDHERQARAERLHAQALRGEWGKRWQESAQAGTLDVDALRAAVDTGKAQRRAVPSENVATGRLGALVAQVKVMP